jgi:uncharacterized protein (TIGR03086 family)
MTILEQFSAAQELFGSVLAQVPDKRWHDATPCTDWDVRALVSHVTGEDLWMPPLFDGKTIAEVGDEFDGDILGDDPVATYSKAADEAYRVVSLPGALEATVHLSFGDSSGTEYVNQTIVDHLVHAWDLAMAIGVQYNPTEELLEHGYDFLTPQAEAWRSSGAFKAKRQSKESDSTAKRLIALTGRDWGWKPPQ